ncbi:MAG TPA: hypothetical protein VF365_03725 [Candidatus Limnocylindria bacterium]
MRRGALAIALFLLVVAAACSPASSPLPRMVADLRPELMTADRPEVRPGDAVTIAWSTATVRGVAYRLGRMAADGEWTVEYFLGIGSGVPGSWHRSDDDVEIPAMALTDRGPDRLRIPEKAEPGAYRLCTLDDPGMCVAIEVD